MPNRREHDHIGQIFREGGIAGNQIPAYIETLNKVESKLTDRQFDAVVSRLAKDSKFRAAFLKDPMVSMRQSNIL